MAKTKVTKEDIEHVSELIMVKLTDEEKAKLPSQLVSVLEYVGVIDEIDTKDTKETHHVTGLQDVLDEDVVRPSLTQQESLSNAIETEDGYVKVKGKLSAGADA